MNTTSRRCSVPVLALLVSPAFSAGAVSIQTLSNPVADGSIVVDFNQTEDTRAGWENVTPYQVDVDGTLAVLSIETIQIAHDSTNFYFRFLMDATASPVETDPDYDPQQSFFGSHHGIFLDTDQNRATGALSPDGDFAVGANYMIEGPGLFRFGNLSNPIGPNQDQLLWTWGGIIPFGNVIYDDGTVTDIEFLIPRTQMGNPEAFDFFAITSDVAFTTTDVFPNNGRGGESGDFFTYSTVAVAGIDGDYNDSGLVEQGDLDQVLANWGAGFASIPPTWINQRPTEGIVDQAELDVVLTNWGSSSAPDFAGSTVPEPASAALLSLTALGLMTRRRTA